MPLCKKCNKIRHVIQRFKKEKGKKYLITICATCKGGISIEDLKEEKE